MVEKVFGRFNVSQIRILLSSTYFTGRGGIMGGELPDIHALWIGESLGELSRCCLKSFMLKGHKVYLHLYNDITDIPYGIVAQDANLIIPEGKIIKHKKTGSYALFSDIFRYALLKKVHDNSVYVDCDVYCLEPFLVPENGYFLGYEDDKYVNGAILAIPQESALLDYLLMASEDPMFIPPWYSSLGEIVGSLKS